MYSHSTVKDILETAIDSLVDNFTREPYIHRCEHSIHCELYTMLTVHRALQGLHRLKGDGRFSTTLIHKEWPETEARPDKRDRRGNFDLAILAPEGISGCTVSEFTTGRIRPAFVVEMGLNYGLDHLMNDDSKLANSGCHDGYLVHLWQPHRCISDADILSLQQWIPTATSSVAAVVFSSSGPMVKHLADAGLGSVTEARSSSQSGKGESLAPPPHTTVQGGPHTGGILTLSAARSSLRPSTKLISLARAAAEPAKSPDPTHARLAFHPKQRYNVPTKTGKSR